MEGLKLVPVIFLMLAIGGIVAGTGVLTISTFGDTMTQCDTAGAVYNASRTDGCVNSTNSSIYLGNLTNEFRTTLNANAGMAVVGEQFTTIAIIAIMVIVISLIAGIFVYFQYFR